MTDFTMSTDADGVATIVWDVTGKSMNVLNAQGFLRFCRGTNDLRVPRRAGDGRVGAAGGRRPQQGTQRLDEAGHREQAARTQLRGLASGKEPDLFLRPDQQGLHLHSQRHPLQGLNRLGKV